MNFRLRGQEKTSTKGREISTSVTANFGAGPTRSWGQLVAESGEIRWRDDVVGGTGSKFVPLLSSVGALPCT